MSRMQPMQRPSFDSAAEKRIYRYVERNGRADADRLAGWLEVGSESFDRALERLHDAGYVTETDGELRIAIDPGEQREYETDGEIYTIRAAVDADADGLVDVILRDVTATEKYVVAESLGESILYEDTVNRCNPVSSRIVFVATIGDEIVGWVHLELPQVIRLRGIGYMTIGVRASARGHGIGDRLHRTGIEWAETNDCRQLYVRIPAINEGGIAFLTDRGWGPDAVHENHYEIEGDQVDEVMLKYEC